MSKRRKAKLGIAGGMGILLVALAVLFIMRLNAPHQGIVASDEVVTPAPSFDMTPKQADGQYVSFNYPAGMDVVKNNPIAKPIYEQFNYLHRDIESWNLAIAVMQYPSALNTYQLRKTQPDKYKESDVKINGMPVILMTDASVGGFSKVAILYHGDIGATVSLYGDSPSGTKYLQKTFDLVLNSWQWK